MRKIVFLVALLAVALTISAQNGKKTRSAADNSKENVSARKISGRFNSGLRSYYTAQYEEAERIFSNIIADNSKHSPSYYMLSKIYSENNKLSQAEVALNQAIKCDKDNIWYKVALGDVLIKTENWKKAAPIWEFICGEMPDNELFLFNLYDCYRHLNNYTKMIETLDKMEELFGAKEETTRNKVILWLKKGDVNSALKEYDNMIDKRPYDVSNYLKAGVLCEENNLSERALGYYNKAYSLFPGNADVNMMLANYWILRNDEAKSAQYISFLIPNPDIEIGKKMPFINKQIADLDKKEAKKVENWLRQLLSAHPEEYQCYRAMADFCMKTEKYVDAVDNYEKVLKTDDSEVDVWQNFLASAEKSGKFEKIAKFEEEIATLFPQNSSMLASLAASFLKIGNPDKAIEYYKQALAFAFESAEISRINQGLYDAYMQKGDAESARKYRK